MSVSKWRYTEACEGRPCVGECDLCDFDPEEELDLDDEDKQRQCDEIVRYMTLHGGITQAEAFALGIGRLSARIYELRHDDGYAITTQSVTKKNAHGRTVRFARYVFTNGIHKPTPPKRETPEAFVFMDQLVNDFFDNINKVLKGANK